MNTYTVTLQPNLDSEPFVWHGQAVSEAHAVWLATRASSQHNLTGGPEFLPFAAVGLAFEPVDHSELTDNPKIN